MDAFGGGGVMDVPTFRPESSGGERDARARMAELMAGSPIPERERPAEALLYARRQTITGVFVTGWLYDMVLEVPGVIMELGCRYGSRLALMTSLRGMREPFNIHRRIVGFDTFEGFREISPVDGDSKHARPGGLATTSGYAEHLREVLRTHELESPLSHLRRTEIVEGDVCETLPAWLAANPEAFVALAYLDLDLYKPTLACLEALRPRLLRGSVLAFDEFAHPEWPGETAAVVEALGVTDRPMRRPPGLHSPTVITW
jgi:hypothetical protein